MVEVSLSQHPMDLRSYQDTSPCTTGSIGFCGSREKFLFYFQPSSSRSCCFLFYLCHLFRTIYGKARAFSRVLTPVTQKETSERDQDQPMRDVDVDAARRAFLLVTTTMGNYLIPS